MCPQRFQDCHRPFDLIITCEEGVYDIVYEGEKKCKEEIWGKVLCFNDDPLIFVFNPLCSLF